ncbi:hypothetical protein [Hyalangium versicolor]|uniref:hypothetical protein n=1 Tax=Hyalangium versicolor TaxID=2861190 RepID=UPI001CC9CE54|nr:hypothetical protein [Hyalangium versicolor]
MLRSSLLSRNLPTLRAAIALMLTLSVAPISLAGEDGPPVPEKTQVNDAKAREQLLGEHTLTLQWLSDDPKPGKAQVTEEGGLLKLRGEQRTPKGFLKVDGVIERVDAKSFVFVGRVDMQVDYLYEGKECPRAGRFTFRITGKRRYWRLKEMESPCEKDHVDYVDLFMR